MPVFFLVLLALLPWPLVAETADLQTEGLCAYAAGHFGDAAAALTQSVRDRPELLDREAGPGCGRTAYFLGRSLRELGLRRLALDTVSRAERCRRSEWARLARREAAAIALEAGGAETPGECVGRSEGSSDPEVCYFAGLAAARRGSWPEAIDILGRISPSSKVFGHAQFVRAQSMAAAGDLDASLAVLHEVVRCARLEAQARSDVGLRSSPPALLLDQAELLRGKILYLKGRRVEARASFAAAAASGAGGFEALGGLMLAGGEEAAAKIPIPQSRPAESAALLMAKAVVAEKRDDVKGAWEARSLLRDLTQARVERLEQLGSNPSARAALDADVTELSLRLRTARALRRWQDEQSPANLPCPREPRAWPSREQFRAHDGLSDAVWSESRVDPSLRGLTDLKVRSGELARDLATPAERAPFWRFWRRPVDPEVRQALLVIRLADLRSSTADFLHRFGRISADERKGRRREARDAALRELRALGLGEPSVVPETLGSLRASVAVSDRRPQASVDPAGFVGRARAEIRTLALELAGHIEEAMEAVRRRQLAFFERIDADNRRSLAGLHARMPSDP